MKVAVVTDDLQTISAHFGRAQHYLVYVVEGGVFERKETRDKVGHGPGMEEHHHARGAGPEMKNIHNAMLSNVGDCEAVVSGGMGKPMYEAMRAAGMKVFITRMQFADEAVRALVNGNLDNHVELLH